MNAEMAGPKQFDNKKGRLENVLSNPLKYFFRIFIH